MKNSVVSLNHFTTLPKQIRVVNAFLCKDRLHAFISYSLFTITVSYDIRFLVSTTSFQRTFLRNYFVCLNRNETGSRWRFLGSYGVSTQLRRKRNLKYKFTAEEKPKHCLTRRSGSRINPSTKRNDWNGQSLVLYMPSGELCI